MHIDLSGLSALVTGSSAGIGKAIASGLATSGAHVIVNGRRSERVETTVSELSSVGSIRGVVADVGTADGVATLIDAAPHVDILVVNAAHMTMIPMLEVTDEEWTQTFAVNVFSGIRLSRAYVPKMVANRWGRVIFISSESALQTPAEMAHYGVSKTAELAISRGLATTLAGTGVTVNAVLPGPTTSEIFTGMLQDVYVSPGRAQDLAEAGRRYIAEFRPNSLLGRPATPREVANMVVYVASHQAAATSGAAVRVDGGVLPTIA